MPVDSPKRNSRFTKDGGVNDLACSGIVTNHNDENIFSDITSELQIVLDVKGSIVKINDAVGHVLGRTPDEVRGCRAMKFIHPEDRNIITKAAAEIFSAKQYVAFELRVLHKNGSLRWLSLRVKADNEKRLSFAVAMDITSQKKSENERDQLYDITSDILIISNADGPFSRPNPTCERVLGWSPEEMTSHPWTHFVHPDDIEPSQRSTAELYSGKTIINFENRYRHKDGTYRWLNWRAKLDRENRRVYAGAMDITVRKKIEQERERFFEVASDILVITGKTGFFDKINPACERVLGWSIEQMMSHPWHFFVHPEDVERSLAETVDLLAGKETLCFENRYRHKNGAYRWLSWRARADIEAGLIYASAVDITPRKEFEQERERFFEVASDVLLITDYEGHYTKASPACQRVLGWTPEEMTAHPRSFFVHPDDREGAMERVGILRACSDILHFESRILHHDGSYRWISWRAKGDTEQKLIYYAGFDITEQKQLENRLRQKTRDLAEAKDLAERSNSAKTEFLTNMSHEIRTPMNAVIGLTHILGLSSPLTPRQREFIQVLKVSANSLLALINDLLDIAKIESGNMVLEHVAFNMPELIHDVISMMGPQAQEKGLALFDLNACACITERPFISDPARIRQILVNLCGNAIKFTQRGTIKVMVTCHATERANIEQLTISVEDTGIGIAPEKLGAIFDKFVQADSSINRNYGGTGLGLAITKTLTESMGGTITARSTAGEGSTFTVCLPLERGTLNFTEAGAQAPPDVQNMSTSDFKLLLVEDYGPNILVATNILKSFGYDCDIATNGQDAIRLVQDGGAYSAILMDVQMPDMDGFETTRLIRQHEAHQGRPRLPIIGVTAHALAGCRESCLAAGMDDYISKPLDAALLRKILERFIYRSYEYSPV